MGQPGAPPDVAILVQAQRVYSPLSDSTSTSAIMASSEPFGEELAKKVAAKLKEGKDMSYIHRDFCGVALYFVEHDGHSVFIYDFTGGDGHPPYMAAGSVDKYISHLKKTGVHIQDPKGADPVGLWVDEGKFTTWLSAQSDASLNGDGNQRVTKARLDEFVEQ